MLAVGEEFIADLATKNKAERSKIVTQILKDEDPPRDWHRDKISTFLTKLKKQTESHSLER